MPGALKQDTAAGRTQAARHLLHQHQHQQLLMILKRAAAEAHLKISQGRPNGLASWRVLLSPMSGCCLSSWSRLSSCSTQRGVHRGPCLQAKAWSAPARPARLEEQCRAAVRQAGQQKQACQAFGSGYLAVAPGC